MLVIFLHNHCNLETFRYVCANTTLAIHQYEETYTAHFLIRLNCIMQALNITSLDINLIDTFQRTGRCLILLNGSSNATVCVFPEKSSRTALSVASLTEVQELESSSLSSKRNR